MRATFLASLVLLAACSSGEEPGSPPPPASPPAAGGSGGSRGSSTGGASGSGGGGAGQTGGSGGSAGAGGAAGSGGSAGAAPDAGRARDGGPTGGDAGAPAAGGEAVLLVQHMPPTGTDTQIVSQLTAQGLKVQVVADAMATAMTAAGKRLVVISYSVESANVRGKLADVTTPLILMEHVLLPDLGMTTGNGHGFKQGVTDITIGPTDSPLAAGLSGDVRVFSATGEVFWGVPGPGAIKVATVKGNPNQSVIFAYPQGAMMASKPAPGKRLQFFFGAHEHANPMLNPDGLKLLAAAIAWSIQ